MSEPVDVLVTAAGASGAAFALCLAGTRMLVLCLELRTAYLSLSGLRTYTARWDATDRDAAVVFAHACIKARTHWKILTPCGRLLDRCAERKQALVRFFLLWLCLAPLTGCVALGLVGSLGAASTVAVVAATQAGEGQAEPNSSLEVRGPYNTYFADQFTVSVQFATTPDEAERVAHAAAEDHCTKRAETLVVQREVPDKLDSCILLQECLNKQLMKKRREHPFSHYIQFVCKAVAQ